uniref:Uncharacterized protein n=1 Tax=Salix viminalis TaxID=40686 RepID=A0A6N2K7X7_SALVM
MEEAGIANIFHKSKKFQRILKSVRSLPCIPTDQRKRARALTPVYSYSRVVEQSTPEVPSPLNLVPTRGAEEKKRKNNLGVLKQ